MFNETSLSWETWIHLEPKAQKLIFEQVLRYFIHPLWTVRGIRPLTIGLGRTFQAELNGQTFFLMPGLDATEARQAVHPCLMTRQAVAANQQVLGQLDRITGEFTGDQRAIKQFATQIETYLSPSTQSLDPFVPEQAASTAPLTFVAQPEQEGKVLVLEEKNWSYNQLRQSLRRYGTDLPTCNQWEGAALVAFTHYRPKPAVATTILGLGMTFTTEFKHELLNDAALQKSNPFLDPVDRDLAILYDRLIDVQTADTPPQLTADYAYRTVIPIQLD